MSPRTWSLAAFAVTATLTACGGAEAVRGPALAPEASPDEAVAQANDVVAEVHRSIKAGSPEGMLPVVAEDVFVTGPGPDGVFTERSAVIVALTDALGNQREQKHKVRARGTYVSAAPGGRAAWAVETVDVDGRGYAALAVLDATDDLWVVSAAHVARTIPAKKLKKASLAVPSAAPASPPGAAAAGALAVFQAALAAPVPRQELLAQLGEADEVAAIAPDGTVTSGAKKLARAWSKSLKRHPTLALIGEARTGASRDGALAWISATVQLGDDKTPAAPHRGTYVYVKDADAEGGWRLVAVAESAFVAAP